VCEAVGLPHARLPQTGRFTGPSFFSACHPPPRCHTRSLPPLRRRGSGLWGLLRVRRVHGLAGRTDIRRRHPRARGHCPQSQRRYSQWVEGTSIVKDTTLQTWSASWYGEAPWASWMKQRHTGPVSRPWYPGVYSIIRTLSCFRWSWPVVGTTTAAHALTARLILTLRGMYVFWGAPGARRRSREGAL
jgi:hypothetical protein